MKRIKKDKLNKTNFTLLLLGLGFFFLSGGIYLYFYNQNLITNGIETKGIIKNIKPVDDNDGGTDYEITFEYETIEGEKITKVHVRDTKTFYKRQNVRVYYFNDDPENGKIYLPNESALAIILCSLIGLTFLIFGMRSYNKWKVIKPIVNYIKKIEVEYYKEEKIFEDFAVSVRKKNKLGLISISFAILFLLAVFGLISAFEAYKLHGILVFILFITIGSLLTFLYRFVIRKILDATYCPLCNKKIRISLNDNIWEINCDHCDLNASTKIGGLGPGSD